MSDDLAEKRIAELEAENTLLRAALAHSKDPCMYCQLPAEEMAKCKSGFPGCGRADDMMGCPEFGAARELEKANERANDAENTVDYLEESLKIAEKRIAELERLAGQLHTTVTLNQDGECVAVTVTDKEHKAVKLVWEKHDPFARRA